MCHFVVVVVVGGGGGGDVVVVADGTAVATVGAFFSSALNAGCLELVASPIGG